MLERERKVPTHCTAAFSRGSVISMPSPSSSRRWVYRTEERSVELKGLRKSNHPMFAVHPVTYVLSRQSCSGPSSPLRPIAANPLVHPCRARKDHKTREARPEHGDGHALSPWAMLRIRKLWPIAKLLFTIEIAPYPTTRPRVL